MKKTNVNECVAQGAATWNEREEHMRIMKKIEGVSFWTECHYTTDEEWAMMSDLSSTWTERKISVLPESEVIHILNRNNPEEIMYMFEQYGRIVVNCPYESQGYFSAEAQKIIAKRNNKVELSCLLKYYGFCDTAQMIILTEWSKEDQLWYINRHGFGTEGQNYIIKNWAHNDLITYVNKHGFSAEGEASLIKRGNHNEIMTYLERHGLHYNNITTLLKRGHKEELSKLIAVTNFSFPSDMEKLLLWNENFTYFCSYIKRFPLSDEVMNSLLDNANAKSKLLHYINHRKLSKNCEKRMLSSADEDIFKEYVSRHALHDSNHCELLAKRSEDEIMFYLAKHKIISDDAEKMFFTTASAQNKKEYIEKEYFSGIHILNTVIKTRPVDYELLTLTFLKCQNRLSKDAKISSAPRNEVLARIQEKKKLNSAEIVALFFRNDPELFEIYINTHDVNF